MTNREGHAAAEAEQARRNAPGTFGAVYSYTLLHEAPEEFVGQLPYHLALVRLDDGSLITAQLTDVDSEIEIGDPVEMVTRKLKADGARGMIVYGYKFRPLINPRIK